MNRSLRNSLFFLLGFFFAALVTISYAETIDATKTPNTGREWAWSGSDGVTVYLGSSYMAVYGLMYPGETISGCNVSATSVSCLNNGTWSGKSVYQPTGKGCTVNMADPGVSVGCSGYSYSCPESGGWTLSGDKCTRQDLCKAGTSVDMTYYRGDFFISTKSGVTAGNVSPAPDTLCNGTCKGSVTQTQLACASDSVGSVASPVPIRCTAKTTLTGDQCSTTPTAPAAPTIPNNNPPCTAGQGVIENTSGKVICVSQDSVPKSDTPKQTQEQQKETFPDGSTKTTTTTQTCTGAGACSTTTNTTVTNNTAGAAGQAGTPGTTTGVTDKPSTDTSDYCTKNPNLQFCKGGMNEEATQKKVLEALDKFDKPGAVDISEMEAYRDPGHNDGGALTKLEKWDIHQMEQATGSKPDLELLGKKTAWESAVSSGWFDTIPSNGCTPPDFTIAGHSLDLTKWCTHAETISGIGAYALWFVFLVGAFTTVTGGKKEGA